MAYAGLAMDDARHWWTIGATNTGDHGARGSTVSAPDLYDYTDALFKIAYRTANRAGTPHTLEILNAVSPSCRC
jgi:hypothetical protein